MNEETLHLIKEQCEKIEKYPGFGQVVIKIQNGHVRIILPTPSIMLDNKQETVV